ncbi:MAG: RNA methyltransferase [Phycisphaerales bacterium]|jgi:tRNA G18 (ribose-2'-O)-methylase SpoU|nr:RNA methyltransferase [Phycisphaerales bacterium]
MEGPAHLDVVHVPAGAWAGDASGIAHELDVYRNQKDAWLAAQRGEDPADKRMGLFMGEGEGVLRQMVEAGVRVRSVLVAEHRLDAVGETLARLPTGTRVLVASRGALEEIVGFDMHRGVLACGERPAPMGVTELARSASAIVMSERVANHDNMGGLFRTLAAFAGPRAGVVLSPWCVDPLYRKAVRVSMGQALRLRWARCEGDAWLGSIDAVRDAGFDVLALTPAPDAIDLDEAATRFGTAGGRRVALLVGAEGPGLEVATMARATVRVRIPIWHGADSLNLVVATGVALSRLVRADAD